LKFCPSLGRGLLQDSRIIMAVFQQPLPISDSVVVVVGVIGASIFVAHVRRLQ
jgi:hypothetical protein